MEGAEFQKLRGYRLDAPGHPQGISCGEHGPTLGPIRLLDDTKAGFRPRPVMELDFILGRTFSKNFNCIEILPGLSAIAAALNEGDLMRAMIATQFLRLPVLTEVEAQRATAAEALLKASPDDPKHPGWPAGTPDGRGGQFRPKDRQAGGEAGDVVEKKVTNLIIRRAFRSGVRHLLTGWRVARLLGEATSNAVPVLDAFGDAAGAVELKEMAEEVETLKTEADAALEFAKGGPRTLEELRVSPKDESFSSYEAFKKQDLEKRFGPAGDGYQYHHIVEQGGEGNSIPTAELQSTRNIVRIPTLLHEEINSEFEQSVDTSFGRVPLRRSLKVKSFEEQYERGLQIMRDIGILK